MGEKFKKKIEILKKKTSVGNEIFNKSNKNIVKSITNRLDQVIEKISGLKTR